MNRTHSPLSGRPSTHSSGKDRIGRPDRLMRAAGRAEWLDESSFDQLEQRQMLFALAAPLGGRVAQTDFAYISPYLLRNIPAFAEPVREAYNFDYMGAGVLPLPSPSDLPVDANSQFPLVRIEHTGFGANPNNFPSLRFPGGATAEDGEININLTGARTVSFSFPNASLVGRPRVMRAFEFTAIPPGQLDAMMVPIPAPATLIENNIQVELLLDGVVVAIYDNSGANLSLAASAVPGQTQNPGTLIYRLTTQLPIPDFNEVRFRALGAGDQFDIVDLTGEFPPGMFSEYIDQLTFGARARIAGPNNGVLDTAPLVSPDHAPVGRTVLEIFDNDTGALPRQLATGTTFASGIRLNHTGYAAGTLPQIIAGPGGGVDRALSFTLANAQTFSFSFLDARGNARPMTQFSFAVPNDAANGRALDAGTQIELVRNGRVVRTYTQADFDNADVRVGNAQDPTQFIYVLDTVTMTANFDTTAVPLPIGTRAAFDEVRISRVGGAGTDGGGIVIDRVAPFAPAMAEFFDLYGRPMVPTIISIAPGSISPVPFIDQNDDGVPDYNDGIGRVIISNSDGTTNLTIYGGEIEFDDILGYQFIPVDSTQGNLDAYTGDARFGFTLDAMGNALGLPLGPGSVLIGSPFFRDNTNPVTYHGVDPTDATRTQETPSLFPFHANGTPANNFGDGTPINPLFDLPLNLASDFSNIHTGFLTPAGLAVGAITVHGVVFGANTFGGAVRSLSFGTLLGSVTVSGDIGSLSVAGDSGLYFLRPQQTAPPDDARGIVGVGSSINILRGAGNMYFGSRNAARITVFNDVNNPNLGRLQFLQYNEREVLPGFIGAMDPEITWNGAVLGGTNNAHLGAQPMLFGDRGYRNDTLAGAEFIGNPGSFTTVVGTLGVLNDLQAEDLVDNYVFAGTRGRTITFDASFTPPPNGQGGDQVQARVLDSRGAVLATHPTPILSPSRIPGSQVSVRFTFTPRADDVYYLEVRIPTGDGSPMSTQAYRIAITGMAGVGAGSINVVGSNIQFLEVRTSLGFLRTGSGIVGDDGTVAAISAVVDTIETVDDFLEVHGQSVLVSGDLYGINFGSDVEGGLYTINGNLGSFRTGTFFRAPFSGALTDHGDVVSLTLNVGGRIGEIEILGDVANRRDVYHATGAAIGGPVTIRTGLSGGDGSIDRITVAGVMVGDVTFITLFGSTSRLGELNVNGGVLLAAPRLSVPDGGVIGPINIPTIPDARPGVAPINGSFIIPLFFGTSVNLTANSGISYRITISGGVASQTSFGTVQLLPIIGAPGAALSRIDVTLVGGAELAITTTSPGRLDIGTIAITTAAPAIGIARGSDVRFSGVGEIDIDNLLQVTTGGANLGRVSNSTVGGDIVFANLNGVDEVVIAGNLGRTENPARRRAPVGGLGGILPQGFVGGGWDGGTFIGESATPLEIIGSPVDSTFEGLFVQTGNVTSVRVAGAVADLFVLTGDLLRLVVNSDGVTGATGFDGIVGNILANNIISIDVGQGLAGRGDTPFAEASIVAVGSIGSITGGSRSGGPTIRGLILAANTIAPAARLQPGIGTISITNGIIDGAYIATATGHSWWRSAQLAAPRNATPGDLPEDAGPIGTIRLTNTPLFRSELFATTIGNVSIKGAAFDATLLTATVSIGRITADSFINSTRDGEPLEYRLSQIYAGLDINGITAGRGGDISDLFVVANGSLRGGISAENITRLDLAVLQTMGKVNAKNDIRSSRFTVGRVARLNAGGDIRSTTVDAAGPIDSVTARGEITNTSIRSVGPDGRIKNITATGDISGSVTASGPINSIKSSRGSISGSVTTTDRTDGDVKTVSAAGDINVSFNIARDLGNVTTRGGDIGNRPTAGATRDVIDVGGAIGSLSAGGQLYADVRGGSTIKSIRMGAVPSLPGNDLVGDPSITAFGRINGVQITGDFNGSIISYSGGIGTVKIANGSFRIGNDDDASGVIETNERNVIQAFDGDINGINISNGNLFGNVMAPDGTIKSVNVTGRGPFGRIGIDPTLSTGAAVPRETFRNELPPGTPSTGGFGGTAAFDGPSIFAGRDIGKINAPGGIFETGIFGGRSVGAVNAGVIGTDGLGALPNASFIAAGDNIRSVNVRGNATGVTVIGGVSSLGADQRIGGAGASADTLKAGSVTSVSVSGNSSTLAVVAGVNAGTDGLYNTADGDASETAVTGISFVGNVRVSGTITATTVFADAAIRSASAGIGTSLGALPADARTFTGAIGGFTPITSAGLAVTTTAGETALIRFSGAGAAFWDAANNRVVLMDSTTSSSLRVDPTGTSTTLTNFGIVSNDDASLGTLIINARLISATASDTADRNSRVFIDGSIKKLDLAAGATIVADGALPGSGILFAGDEIRSASVGARRSATPNQFQLASGGAIKSATVNGDFGTSVASRIDAFDLGTLSVNGDARGVVSIVHDIKTAKFSGTLIGGRVRAGGSINSLTANATASLARISAGGDIRSVSIRNDASETAILAGTDLGTDGNFGGAGAAADRVTNGNIRTVNIGGNFPRSDIAAGIARGVDGFVNTPDDVIADGRSDIGRVTIRGLQVGSANNSQRYGVIANGSVGLARVGPAILNAIGNFSKISVTNRATPIQITSLTVTDRAPRLYTARLTFSEKLDQTTIAAALSVFEVRNAASAESLIPLAQGTDYTFRFDAGSNTLFVDFVEAITTRDLVGNTPGALPAAGVFRFVLDAAALRGATPSARLDGNSDGTASGDTDDFSGDAIVGDAGDRMFSGRAPVNQAGTVFADLYGPVSLDQLMDTNRNSNGLPDTNTRYTLRGILGDHADANVGDFGAGGDIDVYSITLRAGQVLRLGSVAGSAFGADIALLDSLSNPLFSIQAGTINGALLQPLQNQDPEDASLTFLVRTSGTYILAILPTSLDLIQFNPFGSTDITDPTVATGGATAPGTTGDYAVAIEIFDDGDSGFFGGLPAQNASVMLANIPVAADFAGADTMLGTADDVFAILVPDDTVGNPPFVFQLFTGADNMLGTADDIIFGSNGAGVFASVVGGVLTFTRTELAGAAPVDPDGAGPLNAAPVPNEFRGADNTFNTADDLATVTRAATSGGTFTYVLLPGADGVRGTADDVVFGSNGNGINSTRLAGPDGVFDTVDDVVRLTTESGNGNTVLNAPLTPSAFAGVDGLLGTADDLVSITLGDYVFTLSSGANRRLDGDGSVGSRSDDVITGIRAGTGRNARIVSTRTAGADGIFGNADDVFTSTADAAIGDPGFAGVPFSGQADVDVYHLNGGAPIAAGTRVRATLKVSEIGGNLGMLQPIVDRFGNVTTFRIADNRGLVQFGLFDTSLATNISDANLVAAADNVLGIAGRNPATVSDGTTTYGFDANGDFFMEFAVPPRLDNPAQAGTFALYVQGVVRSDYQLEIVTLGGVAAPAGPQTQNVLIEIAGGFVDFLEANPYARTLLGAFDPVVNGFTGLLGPGNQPAADFFIEQLVTNLQTLFAGAGINVVISTNATDFEGQDFSTVYISGSEPPAAFVNNGTFGASQAVDLFNANRNDSAVIYVSQLNVLGNTPGDAGAFNFSNQLTAAVGRRIGELLGVRTTAPINATAATDVQAANSPTLNLPAGGSFVFNGASRALSRQGQGVASTQFFIGNQNTVNLLQRIFGL